MAVLAANGDFGAASLAYREFRLRLYRELNAEPDPETGALFHQIQADASRRLQAHSAIAEKRSRPGPGIAAPDNECPDLTSVATSLPGHPPSRIPRPLSGLVGREKAVDAVKACLERARLVTLTGTGGVGKTRLAIRIAEEVVGNYPDGVWFVDLAPLADPALVPRAVALVLGVREEVGRPLVGTLCEFLRPKQLLLVLDNCEHLLAPGRGRTGSVCTLQEVEGCAPVAAAVLESSPDLRILATSRQRLGLTGERIWPVPPLSLPGGEWRAAGGGCGQSGPDPRHRRPDVLMQSEAVQLFVERAIDAAPDFVLTDRNAAAVAHVCRQLDGIALAIELAAARLRVLSVEQIAERLDDRFRLLTGGSRTALPRQQTLRATLDWSYQLLSEPERLLLRRLSVFAGGWTLAAADAVCAGETLEPGDVFDLLTQLVDKSLVVVTEAGNAETRFRLLETVRQYGRDRLLEAGEADLTRLRHRDWFLEFAEQGEREQQGAKQTAWLERFETEHDNLRAALDGAMEDEDATRGLRTGGALGWFWYLRGYWAEGRERLSRLLALPAAQAPTEARATALHAAGRLARGQGDREAARTLLEEGLSIRRAFGDRRGTAFSLSGLGTLAHIRRDFLAARRLQEESLAIFRELGDMGGIAMTVSHLGNIAQEERDYGAARRLYEESLSIQRALDDRHGCAYSLRDLGMIALEQEEYGPARALLQESLDIMRELDHPLGIASSLLNLGRALLHRGNSEAARRLFEESLSIRRALGDRQGTVYVLQNLGWMALRHGDSAEAARFYEETRTIWQQLGDKAGVADALQDLAQVAWHQGDIERAGLLQAESVRLRQELRDRPECAAGQDIMPSGTQAVSSLRRSASSREVSCS